MAADRDPFAVVAECDPVRNPQATAQEETVGHDSVASARVEDVAADMVGVVVAHEEADESPGFASYCDGAGTLDSAWESAANLRERRNVHATARHFSGRQRNDRHVPIAIGDDEGLVIDEVEPVHQTDAAGRDLQEVVHGDTRSVGTGFDIDLQNETPLAAEAGEGQQMVA